MDKCEETASIVRINDVGEGDGEDRRGCLSFERVVREGLSREVALNKDPDEPCRFLGANGEKKELFRKLQGGQIPAGLANDGYSQKTCNKRGHD